MLSTAGRVAARRVITTRLTSSAPQLLSRSVPAVARSSVAIRAFSVSAWARLPASKASSKKSTAAKDKATKKSASKEDTESETTTTKKAGTKKSKAKRAPKPKKKELTPEQQEKLKLRAERRELRDLKEWALLKTPPCLPDQSWLVFSGRAVKGQKVDVSNLVKDLSVQFKELPEHEREELSQIAKANRETNAANYKAWVETFPVERIYLANKFRRRLTKLTGKPIKPIRDSRVPKLPLAAFTEFVRVKYHSINSDSETAQKVSEIATIWRSLSDAERQVYIDSQQPNFDKFKAYMGKLRADAKVLEKNLKAESQAAYEQKILAQRAAKRERAQAYRDAKIQAAAEAQK